MATEQLHTQTTLVKKNPGYTTRVLFMNSLKIAYYFAFYQITVMSML